MAAIIHALDLPTFTPTPIFELPSPKPFAGWDRRAQQRIRKPFLVRIAGETGQLLGLDLSLGGLQCTCHEPIWPGNVLDLEVVLTELPEPISVLGRVVELAAAQELIAMRVLFEGLDDLASRRIGLWLKAAALR